MKNLKSLLATLALVLCLCPAVLADCKPGDIQMPPCTQAVNPTEPGDKSQPTAADADVTNRVIEETAISLMEFWLSIF